MGSAFADRQTGGSIWNQYGIYFRPSELEEVMVARQQTINNLLRDGHSTPEVFVSELLNRIEASTNNTLNFARELGFGF